MTFPSVADDAITLSGAPDEVVIALGRGGDAERGQQILDGVTGRCTQRALLQSFKPENYFTSARGEDSSETAGSTRSFRPSRRRNWCGLLRLSQRGTILNALRQRSKRTVDDIPLAT